MNRAEWIDILLAEGIISMEDAAQILADLPRIRIVPDQPTTFKNRRAARNLEKYLNEALKKSWGPG